MIGHHALHNSHGSQCCGFLTTLTGHTHVRCTEMMETPLYTASIYLLFLYIYIFIYLSIHSNIHIYLYFYPYFYQYIYL